MTMTKVEIDVPEEIVPYTVLEDKDATNNKKCDAGIPLYQKWCHVSWKGSRNAWAS